MATMYQEMTATLPLSERASVRSEPRHALWWHTAGLTVTTALVLFCIAFVDRPVAIWIHERIGARAAVLDHLLDLPIVMTPPLIIYVIVYAIRRTFARRMSVHEHVWFVIATTFVVGLEFKNILKVGFGRTWPTLTPADASDFILPGGGGRGFIADGSFGFYPFAGTKPFTAFPSGSLAIPLATCVQLWVLYPPTRVVALVAAVLSAVALLATNTHFVSDLVAGTYVGLVLGLSAIALTDVRRQLEERRR